MLDYYLLMKKKIKLDEIVLIAGWDLLFVSAVIILALSKIFILKLISIILLLLMILIPTLYYQRKKKGVELNVNTKKESKKRRLRR